MKRVRLAMFASAVAFFSFTLVAAPRPALACTGVCQPQHDALGGLVGCCNEDCTWKTGNNTSLECVDPNNPCQAGHCWEDFGPAHTCQGSKQSGGTNFSNVSGHPFCLRNGNACNIGQCYSSACTYLGNDSDVGFQDRCQYNHDDPCLIESCQLINGVTFDPVQSCSAPSNAPNGTACDDGNSAPCQNGQCQAGACVSVSSNPGDSCGFTQTDGASCIPKTCQYDQYNVLQCTGPGTPITCPLPGDTSTLNGCQKWVCSWQGSTPTCTRTADVGKVCDTDPNDCTLQTCTTKAKCHATKLPAGVTKCDPLLTDCNSGVCDSRANCTGIGPDPLLQGHICDDGDSNVCTRSQCNNQGACTALDCNAAAACGCGGHCGGAVGSCACQ